MSSSEKSPNCQVLQVRAKCQRSLKGQKSQRLQYCLTMHRQLHFYSLHLIQNWHTHKVLAHAVCPTTATHHFWIEAVYCWPNERTKFRHTLYVPEHSLCHNSVSLSDSPNFGTGCVSQKWQTHQVLAPAACPRTDTSCVWRHPWYAAWLDPGAWAVPWLSAASVAGWETLELASPASTSQTQNVVLIMVTWSNKRSYMSANFTLRKHCINIAQWLLKIFT